MKKILIILCMIVLSVSTWAAHLYTDTSVLSEGNWVKIRVDQSGVYKMTYDELKAAGLSHPENVRVYGYGGAMLTQDFTQSKIDDLPSVGFWMEKGDDGVFGKGDYILFYAQGSISWKYNGTRFAHTRNTYSDYGYYFLSDDAGEQNILSMDEEPEGEINYTLDTYTYRDVHEKDLVNLIDASNGVEGGGREFYGEELNNTRQQLTVSFAVPEVVTSEKMRLYIDFAASSNYSIGFTVTSNGTSNSVGLPTTVVSDFYTKATTGNLNKLYPTSDSKTQSVVIRLNSSATSGKGYLNYIELNTSSNLVMQDDWMTFRNPTGYEESGLNEYLLTGANANTQIWDITDLSDIRSVYSSYSNDTLSFNGSNEEKVREYIAVNTKGSDFLEPTVIGAIANQNLHKLNNIDYVIITPEQFVSQATLLAQTHEQKEGITWAVVTDQQVYNEFSSGTPDATAYRWIMKMLYDKAQSEVERPKWLLLFGDGTFDNRKLLTMSGQNTLLTYQAANSTVETKAYGTDDYFGFLGDNEGTVDVQGRMKIGVGRLPVNTEDEANDVVNKIVKYITQPNFGKWKNQLVFLADDGDNGLHITTAESGGELVRKKNLSFVVNKIYLDAYPQESSASGESYPLAQARLENLLKNGVLYMNYSGHGGYNAITNEGLMTLAGVKQMTNENQGLWMMATCSFSLYDAGKRSIGEEAVLNPNGGAIAVMAACRTVYASQNTILNQNFCDTLFGHKDDCSYEMTIGEATAIAKNLTGNDENKMAYLLLGDPALHLAYPTNYQVKTVSSIDTLHALTEQTVQGEVWDSNDQRVDWFNGKVQITMYDKMQSITTRDNDEKTESKQKKFTYNDYPNTLYSGVADVTNGKFEFSFMTPKDIRYNYGNGRIVYYAYDEADDAEGIGHFEDFIIGGTGSVVAQSDTIGPKMHIYLNTPAFQDGGMTYETPRFFADLEDEHGINTVGSGIGHDLMLIIDNSTKLTYVLNEFFNSDGSYTKGQVSYLMPELEDGEHVLTFRAWDLMNNSTTDTLHFVVQKGMKTTIYEVEATNTELLSSNGILHMDVLYDQPDRLLETDIFVFDVTGHTLYHQTIGNPDNVDVDLSKLGLAPGVYMYNVRIKTTTNQYTTRGGKFIITK